MTDQFTEITSKSWGQRIIDSIKGIVGGFLMFIVSFAVLYWNEGRVDLSSIAKTAVEIEATSEAPTEVAEGLISTTGVFKSDETIGDDYLQVGEYLAIRRTVEMYAWKEYEETETERKTGGSETQKTTYSYKKVWSNQPENSAYFKYAEGHENPEMSLPNTSVRVERAKLGVHEIDMNQLVLPDYQNVQLNENNVIIKDELSLANDQYLFGGQGAIDNPEIGDIRVSYSVLASPLEPATVFGKLDGANNTITAYYDVEKEAQLYRLFEGARDPAIATMKREHSESTWILRGVGFMLMWFGLMALFQPISVFLDVLPIFGSIGRAGIGAVTFGASVVLSIVTILVSMIFHSTTALIIVIIALIVGTIWYLKNKRRQQKVGAEVA